MITNLTKRNKKCSHKIITEKLTKKSRAYFYCYKCGKLIIVKDLNIYESLNKGKLEFNPIKMISQMLLKQEKDNKAIKEKFNKKNDDINLRSNIYIKNRDVFISYLNQFCNKMNYSENTFYNCLYLLDSYLIHIIKKEITKRTIILILLGFFLISSKFIEDDIFEPNVNQFCKIEKNIVVSPKEILNMEIKCLQLVNYNMVNYSAFDWLKIFNKLGIVFTVDSSAYKNEEFFEKQKYILKRIINTDILYKFDSFKVALSIIHISMDKILLSNKINKDLFSLFLSIFNYKFADFEQCYTEIKKKIFNYNDYNNIDKRNNDNININEKEIFKTESNSKKMLTSCYNKSVQNILKQPIQLTYINNSKNNKSQPKKIFLSFNDVIYANKNKSEKIIKIFNDKKKSTIININHVNENDDINKDNNNKKEKETKDYNTLILPKNKLLYKKEKQHLTIDCNNNLETLKNEKMNDTDYNNIINTLLKKTKKINNSHKNIFNSTNYANIHISRNNINNCNNDIIRNNHYHTGNMLNKNEIKKSFTSLSNSPMKKGQKNFLKENKLSLLYNLNNFKTKNKNILKMLNIDSNKNTIDNISIKTFYNNNNQVKNFILNKKIFNSLKDWKKENAFPLRNNNNNIINANYNKNVNINKEMITPYIKHELMNLSNN